MALTGSAIFVFAIGRLEPVKWDRTPGLSAA
jgi:hypothetical protein